jgi:hypothetical protein
VLKSRAKTSSKLYKVLQEKVSQKHKKIAHDFEVTFSMSLHFTNKHQVSTIMSQKFTQVLEKFTTTRHIELTKIQNIFPIFSSNYHARVIKNQSRTNKKINRKGFGIFSRGFSHYRV